MLANDMPPLHQPMKRPVVFRVAKAFATMCFTEQAVVVPRGLGMKPSITAPIATPSARSDVTSARLVLAAVQTSSGISFLPDSNHRGAASPINWLTNAIDQELLNASTSHGKSGPHDTAASRSVSLTLLLPIGSDLSTHYLNALATLVQYRPPPPTRPRARAVEADATDASGRRVRPVTNRVRFNVACGQVDVAGFLTAYKIKFASWNEVPSVVLSYIDGSSQVNETMLLSIDVTNAVGAILQLKQALITMQQQSNGALAMPASLVDQTCEHDAMGGLSFEGLQNTLQVETKELFYPPISTSVMGQFQLPWDDGSRAFVRVVERPDPFHQLPEKRVFIEDDPDHAPGLLLVQEKSLNWDESLTQSYFLRSRLMVPRDPFGSWPLYGLLPPEDEEARIKATVLWFAPEYHGVGGSISAFSPKASPGSRVTCFTNSVIVAMVARLEEVLNIVNGTPTSSPKWIFPVTTESCVSDWADGADNDIKIIQTNFSNFVSSCLNVVLKRPVSRSMFKEHRQNEPVRLKHSLSMNSSADWSSTATLDVLGSSGSTGSTGSSSLDLPQDVGSSDKERVEEEMTLMALMGVAPGSARAVIDDIYEQMGTQCLAGKNLMSSFHALLTAAIGCGRGQEPLKRVLDESAAMLQEGKRARTEDPTKHLFVDFGQREALFKAFDIESVGEPLNLEKSPSPEGVAKLMERLKRWFPNARSLLYSDLETVKERVTTNWLDLFVEIQEKMRVLSACAITCGVGSNSAKNPHRPPKIYQIDRGVRQPIETHRLLSKRNVGDHLFWFSATESGWLLHFYQPKCSKITMIVN